MVLEGRDTSQQLGSVIPCHALSEKGRAFRFAVDAGRIDVLSFPVAVSRYPGRVGLGLRDVALEMLGNGSRDQGCRRYGRCDPGALGVALGIRHCRPSWHLPPAGSPTRRKL